MKKSTLAIVLMLGAALSASAITTTLEYEDQREAASRSAISNEITTAVGAVPVAGNYAAVSNAAMKAVQPNAATNIAEAAADALKLALQVGSVKVDNSRVADEAIAADGLGVQGHNYRSDTEIFAQIDAANGLSNAIPNNITRTANDATLVHCDNGTCTNALVYIRQASSSLAGLMTAADKRKIDDLASVALSGDYNDLDNKPTIPANAADVGAYPAASGNQLANRVAAIGNYETVSNRAMNAITVAPEVFATNLIKTVMSNSLYNLTYDQTLGVTWRKTAEGGAFYERCYTNVNMIGVLP